MQTRLTYQELDKLQPLLTSSLLQLGESIATRLEPSLIHLVKLRASQLNGCAFCQNMHANEARQDGERQSRLDILAAWKEVPAFSAREQAALTWTEQLTRLSPEQNLDQEYEQLGDHFNKEEIADLTALIIVINGWNRIAIGFRFIPNISDKQ
ncbi:MAG: carboxymuconolactone decarboxylase family protein [Pseudomonadales bacterium]|nr:carboxymuconolactone decarboxylase family protein [Pseudomonadales bacterium]